MSHFPNDKQLLAEAYSVQLLKESFPGMTLSQASANIDLLSESEAEYVCIVSERILNEFFGGLKALGGSAQKATGGSISGALGKVGSGLKSAAQGVANKASQVGSGISQAASQVGNNVKDIYDTGNAQAGAETFAKKAQQYVDALKSELKKAQDQGMITFKGNIDQIPLGEIVDELLVSSKGHQQLAGSAQRKGVLGGVGGAFKQGMQS